MFRQSFFIGAVAMASMALATALSGCASGRVEPGMSRAELVASWGKPTRIVPLPGGERLQYSQQPAGQQAVMVDLDATGHVVQARQVLNQADFGRISTAGDWTRADVEREFGPPGQIEHVARWDGAIMAYRWRGEMADKFFWVYLDNGDVVRRAHEGLEIRNQRNGSR